MLTVKSENTNETNLPITIKQSHHFAQVSHVSHPDTSVASEPTLSKVSAVKQNSSMSVPHSSTISVDPDGTLPDGCAEQLHQLQRNLTMCLINLLKAAIVLWVQSMQWLAWVLFWVLSCPNMLEKAGELQEQFYHSELLGVFGKPEGTDTAVEFLIHHFW